LAEAAAASGWSAARRCATTAVLEIRRLIDVRGFADAGEEANEMHERLEEQVRR
jgi:hypothetical protein